MEEIKINIWKWEDQILKISELIKILRNKKIYRRLKSTYEDGKKKLSKKCINDN